MGQRRIGRARVLLGGLLATFVVGALGFAVWFLLLRGQGPAGMLLEPTLASIALWIGGVYRICTVAVWLYAALRPRYGPGPGTAARAGLTVWVLTGLTDLLWMQVLAQGAGGGLTGRVLLALAAYAVIFPLATMAGAWPYADASPRGGQPGARGPDADPGAG